MARTRRSSTVSKRPTAVNHDPPPRSSAAASSCTSHNHHSVDLALALHPLPSHLAPLPPVSIAEDEDSDDECDPSWLEEVVEGTQLEQRGKPSLFAVKLVDGELASKRSKRRRHDGAKEKGRKKWRFDKTEEQEKRKAKDLLARLGLPVPSPPPPHPRPFRRSIAPSPSLGPLPPPPAPPPLQPAPRPTASKLALPPPAPTSSPFLPVEASSLPPASPKPTAPPSRPPLHRGPPFSFPPKPSEAVPRPPSPPTSVSPVLLPPSLCRTSPVSPSPSPEHKRGKEPQKRLEKVESFTERARRMAEVAQEEKGGKGWEDEQGGPMGRFEGACERFDGLLDRSTSIHSALLRPLAVYNTGVLTPRLEAVETSKTRLAKHAAAVVVAQVEGL